MKDELKVLGCPFCGSQPKSYIYNKMYRLYCPNKMCSMEDIDGLTLKEATLSWNDTVRRLVEQTKTDSQLRVIKEVIECNGSAHQIGIALEELGELQHELFKCLREKGDRDHVIEEMADVEICLQELKEIFHITTEELHAMIARKVDRLDQMLRK